MVVTGWKKFVATEQKQIRSLLTSRVFNGENIMFSNSRHRQVCNWRARFLVYLSVRSLRCCHTMVECTSSLLCKEAWCRMKTSARQHSLLISKACVSSRWTLFKENFSEVGLGTVTFKWRLLTNFRKVKMEKYAKKARYILPLSVIQSQSSCWWMCLSEKDEWSDFECLFVVTLLNLSCLQSCFTKKLGIAFCWSRGG